MNKEEAISFLSMIEFENAECHLGTWYSTIDTDMKTALDMAISALSENKGFDGMTNEEVILTMFDTATVYGIDKENDYITICIDNNFYQKFRYSWWNAPYKAESEDKE